MAVALDAASSNDTRVLAGTALTHTLLTVGVGVNRAVVFTLFFGNWVGASPTGVSVTWDSGGTPQVCNLIKSVNSTSGKGIAQVWGLVAPNSGTLTLSVAWTNASDAQVAGVAYSGADQTSPFDQSTTSTGNSSQSSVTVTTSINDAVVAAHIIVSTIQSVSSTNFTTVYNDSSNANFSTTINHEEGNSPVTMTATFTGADFWATAATNVKIPGEVLTVPTVPFGIIGSFDTEW